MKLRKVQDDFIAATLDIEPNDKPKKFCSFTIAKRQDQIGIPPLMSDTGIKVDSRGKAETLNAQFQQVFYTGRCNIYSQYSLLWYSWYGSNNF